MELHLLENRKTGGYTTFGSIWAKGEVKSPNFVLNNELGERIPSQTRVTAWWPDGSIKWAAHTAASERMGEKAQILSGGKNTEKAAGITIHRRDGRYYVDTGRITLQIPDCACAESDCLAEEIFLGETRIAARAVPVLILERRTQIGEQKEWVEDRHRIKLEGSVDSVCLEDCGPLECVFCLKGSHKEAGSQEKRMPFAVRLYLFADSCELRFVHTFFYDGTESEDFLKGMGIRFETEPAGSPCERHIKFGTDRREFHEAAVLLNCNHPKLDGSYLERQMDGETGGYAESGPAREAEANLPVWNRYTICQDSPSHFLIRKQIRPDCCALSCLHGIRAAGTMAVCGNKGGLVLGIKDFWKKYPAGFEADGLADERTSCTAWFYSPEAEAYDFRHYSDKSYMLSSYEGFEKPGASAYGIGVTSECRFMAVKQVPSAEALEDFSERMNRPAVYAGTPEYYHEKKAFGYWSLKNTETETERWMENQLEKAFEFYRDEVENRSWYGLFDYGDFMHTYDGIRHCWRYDMGGFAWQNTELVPTYWLWLYFLRTGREDVYTVAEAMSRHCSEVDLYHFGPMKGIGSRHNVRHWGCSCKEPRVSMAGHHRFYYYLTGDFRMGEVLSEVKDADRSLANLWFFRDSAEYGNLDGPVSVRSGPDWSSFVANWMTQYERTLDPTYRKKIETGIDDLKRTPFGLASGPSFQYDLDSSHLIYREESESNGNMHLQICMGGPEIWMEAADMLEDAEFVKLLLDHGRFYFLRPEEKKKETGGQIEKRPFAFPYFASALAAYSAAGRKDAKLAKQAVTELLHALASENDTEGFEAKPYDVTKDGRVLKEISWIKTNFAAQWCLNAIVVPEFIREWFPETTDDMRRLLSGSEPGNFHRA